MSRKSQNGGTTPPAPPEPAAEAVAIERPRKGGSYVADAATGEIERKHFTKPADAAAAPAATAQAGESSDQGEEG
ncbi:hypothetical protein AAG602_07865 [Citromicrobium bathyomarinum]